MVLTRAAGRRASRRGVTLSSRTLVEQGRTREVFWHLPTWAEVLWYVLAIASVIVFAYGVVSRWPDIAKVAGATFRRCGAAGSSVASAVRRGLARDGRPA